MKTSLVLWQDFGHRLYTKILVSAASNRYVIVDPNNRNDLLYLTRREYVDMSRVALSNDAVLEVLATPQDRLMEGDDGRAITSRPSGGDEGKPSDQKPSDHNPQSSVPQVATPNILGITVAKDGEVKVMGYTLADLYNGNIELVTEVPSPTALTPYSRAIAALAARPARNFSLRGNLSYMVRSKVDTNFLEVSQFNLRTILRSWGVTLHLRIYGTSGSLQWSKALNRMLDTLTVIVRTRGVGTTLKYIKACNSYMASFLSGRPLTDSWSLGVPVALAGGLPKIIPQYFRHSIRRGDLKTYRFMSSLFVSYKGLIGGHKPPTLESIATPRFAGDLAPFQSSLSMFWREVFARPQGLKDRYSTFGSSMAVFHKEHFVDLSTLRRLNPTAVMTAGPNFSPSIYGAALDALAWEMAPRHFLRDYWSIVGCDGEPSVPGQLSVPELFDQSLNESLHCLVRKDSEDATISGDTLIRLPNRGNKGSARFIKVSDLRLGKLSLKYEAATKVRVFAICDYWTQVTLKPLHDILFMLLKGCTSDATFDQGGALKAFVSKSPKDIYSFDLSNADRKSVV